MQNGMMNGSSSQRKKTSLSFVIRNEQEPLHRGGVSSLAFDPVSNRLITGGCDSIIRMWNIPQHKDAFSARGGVQSPGKVCPVTIHATLEEHTDWINDVVLADNNRLLLSASNDTTVKMWNIEDSKPRTTSISTSRAHKDYVSRLAYAPDARKAASGSYDHNVFLYDIPTATKINLTSMNTIIGSKNSIYALTMTPDAKVVIASGTEKLIRFVDTRMNENRAMKLRGHDEIVRSIVVNDEGTIAISSGSDGTIRMWDLGQQRCFCVRKTDLTAVWDMQIDADFTNLYFGGKGKKVYKMSINEPSRTELICEDDADVRKLLLDNRENPTSIWVSTLKSNIKRWPLARTPAARNDAEKENDRNMFRPLPNADGQIPVAFEPELMIPGAPAIKSFFVFNDKRHIITRDSEGCVAMYDVLAAKRTAEYGAMASFDNLVKEFNRKMYVPSWFNVELKTGMLQITLDEVDAFSAWINSRDAGFDDPEKDAKINYGGMMIRSLYARWRHNQMAQETTSNLDGYECASKATSHFITLPPHTPFILCEGNGRPYFRVRVQEAVEEGQNTLLSEHNPPWITDVLEKRVLPKQSKMPFFLLPHSSYGLKQPKKDRLSATEMLQIRKVMEHVYEKILPSNENPLPNHEHQQVPLAAVPLHLLHTKIEMFCNDEKIDPEMDLRTVKHFYWKQAGELLLCYKQLK